MSINDPVVAAVSAQLSDVDDATVAAVLAAWNAIKEGSPLGTIVTDPSGSVAVRVSDNGVHMWRVTAADGSTWSDMQPTLAGWTVVKEGVADE